MDERRACPCGETPKKLSIVYNGQGGKWASVCGDCCGEWSVEFRTQYSALDSAECMTLAIEAWNRAPRAAILPQWISASERLPGREGEYLVKWPTRTDSVRLSLHGALSLTARHKTTDFLWYGPLPQPPKEEG